MSSGPEEIAIAVDRLKRGTPSGMPGIVAFPTETVYGLGASALDAGAVARVFALKGRPASNPLIVHVSDVAMARRVASSWPDRAETLAQAFWPGPLTLIVPKAADVPAAVTAGGSTVAVRMPDHPLTLALIEAFGGPLVGPSANKSGHVSPTTALHVREAFADEDVYVLDGGPCVRGLESTVVDVSADHAGEVVIRRLGPIDREAIERALGVPVRVDVDPGKRGTETLVSPGQLERHYAPRTPARLFERADWPAVLARASREAERCRVVVLTHTPVDVPSPHVRLVMPHDASAYAARLYAALREADKISMDLVLIEAIPDAYRSRQDASFWVVIADRLSRATA